jgi:hypothetical protein
MLLEGILPKEISFKLKICKSTIYFHTNNILHKMKVNSIQELISKKHSNVYLDKMPIIIASSKKPFIMTFYDNSIYNKLATWQYNIIPPIFHTNKVTAGNSYTFSYHFTSNVDFLVIEFHLVDNTPEADFFTLLSPTLRPLVNGKANTEYKGSVIFNATKSAIGKKLHSNVLFIDLQSDKNIKPILSFFKFEFEKN